MKIKAVLMFGLRTLVPLAIGSVVMILVILWMIGFFNTKIAPEATRPPLRSLAAGQPTDTVREVSKEYYAEAMGTLKAATRTEVSSRIMAVIEKIYVRAGSPVEANQPLVDLDARDFVRQRNQRSAELAAAEAELQQARNIYNQRAPLREKNVISQEEYDDLVSRVRRAEAAGTRAKEALAEAEVMMTYTVIRAPKSGVIVDRLAEEGDVARPGVPLLVLYDPTSLRLEAPVTENLRQMVREGEKLKVSFDALGDRAFEGTVDEIVPQAEAASRSFLVKVSVPLDKDIYEGMSGRLQIPAGTRRHICLDVSAIERIGQNEFVNAVTPEGKLERRFITTGREGAPGHVEVLSGLQAGDRVVLHAPPHPLPLQSQTVISENPQ